MKIALLSGAYVNAGDYLIVKRSKELLKHVYPNCVITEYERKDDLSPIIDEINKNDVLILAGGPGYIPNVYPDIIPLVPDLDKIKSKIFILGMGWFGKDSKNETIYNYKFNENTKKLLNRVREDGFSLGCRDWESVRVLKNNGFENSIMTGCPAWHNLEFINKDFQYDKIKKKDIKNICISDPGNTTNYDNALNVAKYLKKYFNTSKIKFVFHKGIGVNTHTTCKRAKLRENLRCNLEDIGIECVDIAYDSKGFDIYNDCQLHIGFRVHAHIYNLSRKNISILIEEDGRGAGVNNALGLERITSYSDIININNNTIMKISYKVFGRSNKYLIDILDDYIFKLFNSNFKMINNATCKMKEHYYDMIMHLEQIGRITGE